MVLHQADLLVCGFLESTMTSGGVASGDKELVSFRRGLGIPEKLLNSGFPHPELGVLGCRFVNTNNAFEHIIIIHESFHMSQGRGVTQQRPLDRASGSHLLTSSSSRSRWSESHQLEA